MTRLPNPGSDNGAWGDILNDYLSVEHTTSGALKLRTDGTLTSLYTKPGGGIPSTDLASAVQGTLNAVVGKVSASAVTTKGDLLVASGAGVVTRLGAGSNGQKLVADAVQASGLKWAADAWVLASDYGVTFDGTTDDATALQAAIAAAIAANKPLLLNPGTAIIGTSLSIAQPLTIIGSGREATILKAKSGLNDYVIKFTGGVPGTGIVGVHFADFAVDGNNTNQTAGGCISADGAIQCSFERLHFYSAYNWGIKLGPITGGAFGHHNHVVSCLFDTANNTAGFGGGAWTTSSDENFFLSSDFEFLGGQSAPVGSNPVMLYDNAGLQHIVNCNFVSGTNNVIGIRVQNAKLTKVVGCTFDGIAGDCVFIAGNKNSVVGSTFTGPGDAGTAAASGVHLEFNTHYNVVSSNTFETSTTNGRTRSLIREEGTGGSGDNIITSNTLSLNTGTPSVALLETAGTNTIVRNNIGFVTEANGTATVANGTTTIVVTHGLGFTPTLQQISATPTNSLGSAAKFWISTPTATQFTINVNADPGATTATFAWSVRR